MVDRFVDEEAEEDEEKTRVVCMADLFVDEEAEEDEGEPKQRGRLECLPVAAQDLMLMPLEQKAQSRVWFTTQIRKLRTYWSNGHFPHWATA